MHHHHHDDDSVPPDAPVEPLQKVISFRDHSDSSLSTIPDAEQKYGWQIDATEFENIDKSKPALTRSRTAQSDFHLSKQRTHTAFGGRIKLRPDEDDEPTDWWFASTAIPLIVATFAPMANMLSIAALVVSWRLDVTTDDPLLKYATGSRYADPTWCLDLNGASLACGFLGNAFLLFNFTRKVRYIIALPVSIVLFFLACAILAGITISMHVYAPPTATQIYSQGFWHAIIAACLYLLCGMLLMGNMLGYFLGHYNQHFDLSDEQRNLILQTMIFFLWLAGGAGVFARIEGWTYPDALYFCDVTLLTIGFGDFYATNDVGRGLVFPFSVGGTIILGLMVSSIHKFAQELSKENVVKKHVETRRVNTLSRAVTEESQLSSDKPVNLHVANLHAAISRPLEGDKIQHDLDEKAKLEKAMTRTIGFHEPTKEEPETVATTTDAEPTAAQFKFVKDPEKRSFFRTLTLDTVASVGRRIPLPNRHQKAILMRDEKDRFDRMRKIQYDAARFKKWYALTLSIVSFGLLWCVGAMVFFFCEQVTQDLSYFQSLYFCYVSLLTIGYGDLSPRSNSGKAFFVLWSLIAVPTMTILVSDLGDTVIGGFKRRVLKYGGLAFLGKGRGWGLDWFAKQKSSFQRRLSLAGIGHEKAPRIEAGTAKNGPEDETVDGEEMPKTITELAEEEISEPVMMRRLAYALRRVADDMKNNHDRRYSYEEWVEYTRLIRFTRLQRDIKDDDKAARQLAYDEAVDGIIEWDWLDNKSPMTSEQTESEWLLDRLLESLLRSFRKADLLAAVSGPHHHRHHHHQRHHHIHHSHHSDDNENDNDKANDNDDDDDNNHHELHELHESRMSISHARRYSSIDSSHSRPHSRMNSTVAAASAAIAAGDTIIPKRKRSSVISDSDEAGGWSKRGQARIQARQQARRKSLGTGDPGHAKPHLHLHSHQHVAHKKHGTAAVSFEHHKQKAERGLQSLMSRKRQPSATSEVMIQDTTPVRRSMDPSSRPLAYDAVTRSKSAEGQAGPSTPPELKKDNGLG